jgi:hypothetical protein
MFVNERDIVSGTLTTSNNSWQTIWSREIPSSSMALFAVSFAARTGATPDVGYRKLDQMVKRSASGAPEITLKGSAGQNDSTLNGIDIQLAVSGNNVLVQVKGLTGVNIEWGADGTAVIYT